MKFFVITQNAQAVKWKYNHCCNRLVERTSNTALLSQTTYAVSPYFVFFLINEINISKNFRQRLARSHGTLVIKIVPPSSEFIDRVWGEIICKIIWESIELDYLFSWLSTLGGAFSSLGDYYEDRAQVAGKISINQLRIAKTFGDPAMQARCKLYFSISLIQQDKFKMAQTMIREQYEFGKSIEDTRLVKMCLGIWSKLQYSHKMYKIRKRNKIQK